ncbi:MAG: hypothetical protein MJ171_06535, partial [Clostridia bacterium]|nr:hypothetical protein [Clostridia bacterium]
MSIISVSGASESRVAPVISEFALEKDQSIVVCSSMERARRLALDLSFFIRDKEVVLLSETDSILLRYDARNRDDELERLKALKMLRTGEKVVIICPVSSFIHKLTPHS